jgi:hypothetical protein
MPLYTAIEHEMVAANEEFATCGPGAQSPTSTDPTLARLHREWCTASTNECWPFRRAALATTEEIRRAHALRLQVRERYMGQPTTSSSAWCVGVE